MKTKILVLQALVTFADLRYSCLGSLVYFLTKRFTLVCFLTFLHDVIRETRRAHLLSYVRFYCINIIIQHCYNVI